MNITIQQKAGLSTQEYVIAVNGKAHYFAFEAYRNFHTHIDILSAKGIKPAVRIEIKRHKSLLNEKFTIRIAEDKVLRFEGASFWYHDYAIFDSEVRYEIIGHRGLSASIFRKSEQIGQLTKLNIISVLGKGRYQLQANENADLQMLLALALIWDHLYGNRVVDIGQLFQSRAANREWKPK
ncbi:MAG: hypothetical protein AAFP77_22420 [Bacteroidota bacterium]